MPARVVVTGGAGFIGTHIVRRLVDIGSSVVVLDDMSSGSESPLVAGAEFERADVSDPDTAHLIADLRPDVVVHAAAQVSVPISMSDPSRDRRINLEGTQNVIDGARLAGAQGLVFLSSGGAIYGETRLGREDDPPGPASFYGIHKLAAEGYVKLAGLRYANLRLANVYGPNQRSDLEGGVVAILVERLRDGLPITIHGTGEQVRDFVHVHDVVSAVVRAVAAERSGTWNVGTGVQSSVRELLAQLEALMGPAVEIRGEPAREGDVMASCLAFDRIRQDLGWEPRYSLGEGLRNVVESLDDHPPMTRATPVE